MITVESEVSHRLDSKKWLVGRAEERLPVVGGNCHSTILSSYQLGNVHFGDGSAFFHHFLEIMRCEALTLVMFVQPNQQVLANAANIKDKILGCSTK